MKRIAELRKSKGWTQRELAKRARTTQSRISEWENGVMPTVHTLIRLAKALGCKAGELL
jgi:transcriptional regulator with XRE-family HTH domain